MSFSCWQFGTSMELPWESTKTSMAQARATSTSVGFGRPGPCIRFFSKWPPTWNLHLSDSFFNYISTSSWNMFAVESPHRHSPAFGRSYGQPSLKKSQPTTTFFLIYCSCLAQNMSKTSQKPCCWRFKVITKSSPKKSKHILLMEEILTTWDV